MGYRRTWDTEDAEDDAGRVDCMMRMGYIQCVGESYGALAHINMQGGAP